MNKIHRQKPSEKRGTVEVEIEDLVGKGFLFDTEADISVVSLVVIKNHGKRGAFVSIAKSVEACELLPFEKKKILLNQRAKFKAISFETSAKLLVQLDLTF